MSNSDLLKIPESATVRFVGDVHLGDGSRNDLFRQKDRLLTKKLQEWAEDSDAIVFMGDFFDLPQAMSAQRIVRAHREVVETVRRISRQVRVVLVQGNHDWRVDYSGIFPTAKSCERLRLGDFLVWHGHALDSESKVESNRYFIAMAAHAMFERAFRFDFRVPLHDFDTWQNRLMHWAGYQFGKALARIGRGENFIQYWSREVWGDSRAMFKPVSDFLASHSYEGMICGHTHLPGILQLGDRVYVNAGSWTFDSANFATWNGKAFEVADLLADRTIHGENYDWMVNGADPGDFFDWWDIHYLGQLKFRPAIDPLDVWSKNA